MSLLKQLFGKKSNETTHLIFANQVFSHGWNDPSEILTSKKSIILDSVSANDDLHKKLNYWNKKYYDCLTSYYSLSKQQVAQISEIINVDPDKYRELYAYWPKEINAGKYELIVEKLDLQFVDFKVITEDHKGKYAIILNERFWDIPTHNSNVLVSILDTYERNFDEFELFHANEDQAFMYAVIIYDRLCLERPPETHYYYNETIKSQLKTSIDIPTFNYDFGLFKPEEKLAEYERIIKGRAEDILSMRKIISGLKERPFKILKL